MGIGQFAAFICSCAYNPPIALLLNSAEDVLTSVGTESGTVELYLVLHTLVYIL